jgi:hypothetical protein
MEGLTYRKPFTNVPKCRPFIATKCDGFARYWYLRLDGDFRKGLSTIDASRL